MLTNQRDRYYVHAVVSPLVAIFFQGQTLTLSFFCDIYEGRGITFSGRRITFTEVGAIFTEGRAIFI